MAKRKNKFKPFNINNTQSNVNKPNNSLNTSSDLSLGSESSSSKANDSICTTSELPFEDNAVDDNSSDSLNKDAALTSAGSENLGVSESEVSIAKDEYSLSHQVDDHNRIKNVKTSDIAELKNLSVEVDHKVVREKAEKGMFNPSRNKDNREPGAHTGRYVNPANFHKDDQDNYKQRSFPCIKNESRNEYYNSNKSDVKRGSYHPGSRYLPRQDKNRHFDKISESNAESPMELHYPSNEMTNTQQSTMDVRSKTEDAMYNLPESWEDSDLHSHLNYNKFKGRKERFPENVPESMVENTKQAPGGLNVNAEAFVPNSGIGNKTDQAWSGGSSARIQSTESDYQNAYRPKNQRPEDRKYPNQHMEQRRSLGREHGQNDCSRGPPGSSKKFDAPFASEKSPQDNSEKSQTPNDDVKYEDKQQRGFGQEHERNNYLGRGRGQNVWTQRTLGSNKRFEQGDGREMPGRQMPAFASESSLNNRSRDDNLEKSEKLNDEVLYEDQKQRRTSLEYEKNKNDYLERGRGRLETPRRLPGSSKIIGYNSEKSQKPYDEVKYDEQRRGFSLGHEKSDYSQNWRDKDNTDNKNYARYSEGNENTGLKKSYGDSRITRQSREFFDRDSENVDTEYKQFQGERRRREEVVFKRVNEIQQDLFAIGKYYSLAHCVAEDMRMGSGIAVTFKRDFKDIDVLFSQKQKQGGLAVLQQDERNIYYLVTKRVSNGKPTYETLWSSLKKMRDHIKENHVEKLAIPRLGCGLDRLEWGTVKHMLEFLFRDVNIEITVCNFQQSEDSPEKPYNNTCKVVHVKKSIADIEEETSIIYLSSEDGHVSTEMEELNKKYPFLGEFNRTPKKVGIVVRHQVPKKIYVLNGCIVRMTKNDPFDFIGFRKCVQQINKDCRKEKYYYVGIQAINDEEDDLLNEKIITILKNYLNNIELYVCWHGDLADKMPLTGRE